MGNRLRWKTTSLFRIGKRHRISSTATPPPTSGPGDNISQKHRRLLCNERSFNKNSHLWVNSGTLTSCDVTYVALTCCFPSVSSIMLCFHRFFQLSSILIFEQEGEKKVLKGVLKLKKPKATHQEKRKHKSNKQQKIVRNSWVFTCRFVNINLQM